MLKATLARNFLLKYIPDLQRSIIESLYTVCSPSKSSIRKSSCMTRPTDDRSCCAAGMPVSPSSKCLIPATGVDGATPKSGKRPSLVSTKTRPPLSGSGEGSLCNQVVQAPQFSHLLKSLNMKKIYTLTLIFICLSEDILLVILASILFKTRKSQVSGEGQPQGRLSIANEWAISHKLFELAPWDAMLFYPGCDTLPPSFRLLDPPNGHLHVQTLRMYPRPSAAQKPPNLPEYQQVL